MKPRRAMNNDQAFNKISRIFDDDSAPEPNEPKPKPSKPESVGNKESEDWSADFEGQLAVDIFQTDDEVKIVAPIAGVKPENLDISITGNNLVIRGTRHAESEVKKEHFLVQECYWGSFSRSIELSDGLDVEKAMANLKNGVLVVTLPKEPKSQTKVLKIEVD